MTKQSFRLLCLFSFVAINLLFSSTSHARCRVIKGRDTVTKMVSKYIIAGEVSSGVYLSAGINTHTEQWPSHSILLTIILRNGKANLSIAKGDPGLLVLASGEKVNVAAFFNAIRTDSGAEASDLDPGISNLGRHV